LPGERQFNGANRQEFHNYLVVIFATTRRFARRILMNLFKRT